MKRQPRDSIRSLAMYLRKACPPPQPVRVRRTKLGPNVAGDSLPGIIRISNEFSETIQLETLVHEFAHQLAPPGYKDHSQAFWLAHGRVYDAFLDWMRKCGCWPDDSAQ